MCDFIFTTALLNPRRTQRSPNLRGLSCKAKKKIIFFGYFSTNFQYKISRKSVPRETGCCINTQVDWNIWRS